MELLNISVTSLNISSFIILTSVFLYFSFLVHRKEFVIKIAFYGLVLAELLISEALILRWIEAGFDHPPLANLYESLISFCWGILLIFLIIEGSRKTKFLGVLISPVILIGMGLASLNDNKSIEPLVPALQSIWLHLHVVTAIFGYGAFVLSAMFGILYLLKAKVSIFYFQLAGLVITLISILGLSIESPIFSKLAYTMSGFTVVDNVKYALPDIASMTQEKFVQLRLEVPWAGTLLLIVFLTALSLLVYNVWVHRTKPLKEAKFFKFFLILLTLTLFYIVLRVSFFTPVKVGDKLAYLFLSSNPYEIALISLTWIFNLLILLFGINLESFLNLLPPEKKLEQHSYKMILLGFPLLSLLIITGAIWANYAWGRYWGWDPKETWSLITWFIYALYFHLRYRKGWIGKPTAIISIIGFIAVIFTYLGVNLLLSGLHSYGGG